MLFSIGDPGRGRRSLLGGGIHLLLRSQSHLLVEWPLPESHHTAIYIVTGELYEPKMGPGLSTVLRLVFPRANRPKQQRTRRIVPILTIAANCNPDGGCALFTFSYKNKVSRYCCGEAALSNTTTACYDGSDAFRIPNAEAVPGYGLLGNVTSFNASTNSPDSPDSPNNTSCPVEQTNSSSCHETAVGAGVGVPLGVIALASVAWALWERRKGRQASISSLAQTSSPGKSALGVYVTGSSNGVSELDSQKPPAELNG